MYQIGILSDTHGLIRPEAEQALQGCAAILHAGDINRQEILDRFAAIAPLYVVRGNNDRGWAEHIPLFLDFSFRGLRIYMTHKKKDLPEDLSGYDLVVYGHSHRYEESMIGRTVLLNPGSCGPRRFHQDITLAIAGIDDKTSQITIQRIDIPHEKKPGVTRETIRTQDIQKIIRMIQSGRTVREISEKTGMDMELADMICRLYLTHPGVTAEGIMTKLGL